MPMPIKQFIILQQTTDVGAGDPSAAGVAEFHLFVLMKTNFTRPGLPKHRSALRAGSYKAAWFAAPVVWLAPGLLSPGRLHFHE